jgi:peptidoglycan/xylan/chitin deacetylase (PgdA/CDA1 family)
LTFDVAETAAGAGRWPGGHRCALCLSFDVDGPYGEQNYQPASNGYAISQTEYDPFGLRRILGILADTDVPATFCWVGKEAVDRPELVQVAAEQGHEIALHSWDHRYYHEMTIAEQRADMTRTSDALADLIGRQPAGHKSAGWRYTAETHQLCQELGLRWVMDIPRGDLPFLLQPDPSQAPLVQLPPSAHWDDYSFFVDKMMTPTQTFDFWRDDLDVIRSEGSLMCLTMHPFVSGRPGPSRALVRLIDYAIDLGDIWLARADQIADWWLSQNSA